MKQQKMSEAQMRQSIECLFLSMARRVARAQTQVPDLGTELYMGSLARPWLEGTLQEAVVGCGQASQGDSD